MNQVDENSLGILKDEDEEDGSKPKKPAKLKNLRVRAVSLVDDPAVPKAFYRFIKMNQGSPAMQQENIQPDMVSPEVPVDTVTSDKDVEASTESNGLNIEDRLSDILISLEAMQERLGEQSDVLVNLSERVDVIDTSRTETETVVSDQVESVDTGGAPEMVTVESESETVVGTESFDTEEEDSLIDADSVYELASLTEQVTEMYESGNLSDEEFDEFNSRLSEIISEVE